LDQAEILTVGPRHVILHFDWWDLCFEVFGLRNYFHRFYVLYVCICLRL